MLSTYEHQERAKTHKKCGLEWRWELSSSRQEAGMRLSVLREKQEGARAGR